MRTLRNTGRRPARTRRIARVGQALGIAALAGGLATLTACADAPLSATGSAATPSGPRLAASTTVGDTTVTSFRVSPTDNRMIVLSGDYKLKIDIPQGAICDPATSGYGPDVWDAPCTTAPAAIDFTAKMWTDAAGHPRLEMTPDVRFMPGKVVTLYIKDQQASTDATSNIAWCPTGSTQCTVESATDASLAPTRDSNGGWVSRRVKHFSGYNVVFGLECELEDPLLCDSGFQPDRELSSASFARASGYITTTGRSPMGRRPVGRGQN